MEYEERFDQAVRVTGVGLFVNLGLTIFKLLAGILGNSTAMVADAVHSLSDFLTDVVVIFGFKIAKSRWMKVITTDMEKLKHFLQAL